MAIIVLDAGHGGADPGAVNTAAGRREKDDNLKMALAVGNILHARGQGIIYTRDGDYNVSLNERSRISNNANADLFISFHRNSNADSSANGVESFVRLNPSAKDVRYAQAVLDNVAAIGVQSNRGVQEGDFSVVMYTRAPAQLLELGFISNAADNTLFDQNFNAYANAVADGILTALGVGTAPAIPPSSGDSAVKGIQSALNGAYGAGLDVDGVVGPKTKRALIRALQVELNRNYGTGLSTDGIFGPRTKAAIRSLRLGDRNNMVWILQAMLYVNGFKTTVDGIYGPNTAAQVRAFQRSKGIAADGIAGKNTFERLAG
jgi:hypothetical protein